MRVEFPNTLDVRFHRYEQGVVWEVLAPFYVIVDANTPEQRIIRVPSGQMTDFASVPRLPIVYLAYANKAHLPAIVHDYLYSQGGTPAEKDFADQVFLNGMLQSGESEADAFPMFEAVHLFGGRYFKETTT